MTDVDIQHFLVVYNLAEAKAHVEEFGTDYDAALSAYAKAEEDFANRDTYDIVLLGADSIETIKLSCPVGQRDSGAPVWRNWARVSSIASTSGATIEGQGLSGCSSRVL